MDRYGHKINQAARKFAKKTNEQLSCLGLYSSQWAIIFCLHNRGPLTQIEIGCYLNVEAPTITRTVARLEELGYVVREAGEDKRERKVFLTPKAAEMIPLWQKEVDRLEAVVVQDIEEHDLAVFQRVLQQMMKNLDSLQRTE
ncbi:MarR family winged helix-turn-helix transcriptional regulator [Brevibacillus massiliensis]|jgi:DNA-binding MarR family transcriptional regulator|uniref:MarR family winged helix-turn-helix transcriptional regulator n=1 Tax=Brevibacillus massiliensis TaxID=1118054 RepID=UPI0002DBA7E6|nr:MarR family transcriptional regulator [Brevibacillus massiliensis]